MPPSPRGRETPQSPPGGHDSARYRMSWPLVSWMIAAGVLHFPVGQYLSLRNAITQPLNHAFLFAIVVAASVGLVTGLERIGVDRAVATYSLMAGWSVFWGGSKFVSTFGLAVGGVVGLAIVVAVVLVAHRVRELRVLHIGFFAWAMFLTLSPLAGQLDVGGSGAIAQDLDMASAIDYRDNGYAPDVYVVVVDAYSGIQVLESYQGWDAAGVVSLERRGFVVEPAWTAYSSTAYSVAGMFAASYPVTPEGGLAPEIPADSSPLTTGEAVVLRYFDQAGYNLTMLEPPWVGYRCASVVDDCIARPLLDGLLYYTLDHSFLGPILDRQVGSAWTYGAMRSFDWLVETADEMGENDTRDFVFAHVLVPHEPFLLDSDCGVNYRPQFDVVSIQALSDQAGTRAYLDQAECVDRRLVELANAIPDDSVVIFVADHGAALSGQSEREPGDWTQRDLEERLSAFFAMRAPADCHPGEPVMIQNLFRGLMRCTGSTEMQDLAPRMFANSLHSEDGYRAMVEVSPARVRALVIPSD